MTDNSKIKVGMVSLGCPKNQTDAEIMLREIADAGFALTNEAGLADVVIINTCGFIQSAKEEAIEEILEAAARKADGINKHIIVTGCLAQRYKDELVKEFPEADAVLGLANNKDIVQTIYDVLEKKHVARFDSGKLTITGERLLTTMGHYAYLRIADGCDNRCSYCAIPLIRGGFQSRDMADIIGEAETLARQGVKELILIAQDTTRYGCDIYGKLTLPGLLKQLCAVEGIKWIRLLYCYPERMTDELIDLMAAEDKILNYIDLPLQHCEGEILHRMNRSGDETELRNLIAKLRAKLPGLILRTTFITGFPGETEKQFETLAQFAADMRFERMGCFPYSAEEGTPAAEFPGQIDEEVKLRRAEILTDQQEERLIGYFEGFVETETEVVCEGYDKYAGMYFGRDWRYAPEIDGMIFFTSGTSGKKPNISEFVRVRIVEVEGNNLIGEAV